jgi:hypothetical protein
MANMLAIAGDNSRWKRPQAEPAGFFAGLWHGMIAPVIFRVSLLARGIRIYETHNRGRRYDFGFLLGVVAWVTQSETREFIERKSAL